jgi:hypothetical protein
MPQEAAVRAKEGDLAGGSPETENKVGRAGPRPRRPGRIRAMPRLDAHDGASWGLSVGGRNPPTLTWDQAQPRTRPLELPRGTERPCASDDRKPEHLDKDETAAGRTPPDDVEIRRSPWDWVLPHVDYAPQLCPTIKRTTPFVGSLTLSVLRLLLVLRAVVRNRYPTDGPPLGSPYARGGKAPYASVRCDDVGSSWPVKGATSM